MRKNEKEFMNAIEAAEAWGVTRRRALQYCKEDRIPGALKLGNSWMIPIDAKKPADMRQVQKNKKASILLIPILIDEDEWLEETVISEGKYSSIAIQAERERAFFRGDFESAIVKSISNADMRPKFSELLFTTHADVILDNGRHTELRASDLLYYSRRDNDPQLKSLFMLGVASISHYLYGNKRIANWISSADFDKVEERVKPFALLMYGTSLLIRGENERAVEAVSTGKNFFDVDEKPAVGSLLLMLQAQALKCCGRESDGLAAVMKAAEIGAKHELYYPLALFSEPDSMADEYFQNKIPEAYDKIAEIRSKIDNITLYDYTYSW